MSFEFVRAISKFKKIRKCAIDYLIMVNFRIAIYLSGESELVAASREFWRISIRPPGELRNIT